MRIVTLQHPLARRLVAALAAVALVAIAAGPAHGGLSFNFTYGSGIRGNQTAISAVERAAAQWSSRFADPVTVNVVIDLQPLGSSVLGQANIGWTYTSFDEVRNRMVADGLTASPEPAAIAASTLPTRSQFQAKLPSGAYLSQNAWLTKANYKALGGKTSGTDGTVTFSSSFAWDYDRTNGITSTAYDFEGIAIHELGHILGILSEVDQLDAGSSGSTMVTPLDMFRFDPADVNSPDFDFTTTARNLVPGGTHAFYTGEALVPMSTGARLGDGRQASHWKDGMGLGIMDPTAARGELLEISDLDLAALDLIGWDLPMAPIPEPATLAFLALGSAFLVSRRRVRG